MTRGSRRVAFIFVAAGCAVALAGCGGSSGSAASGGAASGGGAGSSAVVAPSSTGASGGSKAIDVCATLPASQAAQLSGQQITTAVPRTDLAAALEYGCAYSNDDSSVQVEVSVFEHDAASTYSTVLSGSKNATPVSGLGDKAFFDNDATMYVLRGSDLIQVNGLDTSAECAALAKPVLAAL